jgi:hypothetical protein
MIDKEDALPILYLFQEMKTNTGTRKALIYTMFNGEEFNEAYFDEWLHLLDISPYAFCQKCDSLRWARVVKFAQSSYSDGKLCS